MPNIIISTPRQILHALADRHGFTRGEMVEAFLQLNENYKLLAIAIRICQSTNRNHPKIVTTLAEAADAAAAAAVETAAKEGALAGDIWTPAPGEFVPTSEQVRNTNDIAAGKNDFLFPEINAHKKNGGRR